jgi:hypothetical protein
MVMRAGFNAFLPIICFGVANMLGTPSAYAQGVMATPGVHTIALKTGESVELQELYYVIGCQSMLKSPPEVEVVDGPSQVIASVKEGMVLPRLQSCSNRVSGGTLVLTAKEIEDPSFSKLVLRVTYKTKDGDRKVSEVINLQLIP